jgi:hypothetical protein
MADPRFHKRQGPFSLAYLAEYVKGALSDPSAGEVVIADIAAAKDAGAGSLVYCEDKRHAADVRASAASAVILRDAEREFFAGMPGVVVKSPALAFAEIADLLYPAAQSPSEEEQIVRFALACRNADGGFGGNVGHDSHLLYTLSAVQVLCMLGAEVPDKDKTAAWVAALQQPDGSFVGDRWGEVDTRFSYSALNCLALLGRLDAVDMDAAVKFVLGCQNWDGGFGVAPSAESQAGQIFCCVGALSIANRLGDIDIEADVLKLIPKEVVTRHHVIPVNRSGNILIVAAQVDPQVCM